jgi:predicted oxidoreductase
MVWGTGYGLITALINYLQDHKYTDNFTARFNHFVQELIYTNGQVTGVCGIDESDGKEWEAFADTTILATGGINGNMSKVKTHWHPEWNKPPKVILNGSHHFSDGHMHDQSEKLGAAVVNLHNMWNYAAGIPHPFPKRENHGLSLVPPKSALWIDAKGKRFGPVPLMTAYDTRYLVTRICNTEEQYSWQILNKKIALKELAVSGSEFNDGIKNKKVLEFLSALLLGNKKFVKTMEDHSPDYITAFSLDELAEKMNALTGNKNIDKTLLKQSVQNYDANIRRGKKYHNDEQLRRIAHARQYRGDKVRTSKFQTIDDKKAYPLVAIREFILSRKSLGGIQTNLNSQVLLKNNQNDGSKILKGLYAVGETAGFGGGGSHGKRALEGTFLATCIYTAREAVKHIIEHT